MSSFIRKLFRLSSSRRIFHGDGEGATSFSERPRSEAPASRHPIQQDHQQLTSKPSLSVRYEAPSASASTTAATASRSPEDMITGRKDYLTTLPAELLLNIIVDVDPSSFLDLVQVNKNLRSFVKSNAARICNMVIERHHLPVHKLTHAERIDGWLVPKVKLGNVLKEERRILKFRQNGSGSVWGTRKGTEWELQVCLSKPGPQYLYMLHLGNIVVIHWRRARIHSQRSLNYKTHACYLRGPFSDLLLTLNKDLNLVGSSEKKVPRKITARALLWYYGVEDKPSV